MKEIPADWIDNISFTCPKYKYVQETVEGDTIKGLGNRRGGRFSVITWSDNGKLANILWTAMKLLKMLDVDITYIEDILIFKSHVKICDCMKTSAARRQYFRQYAKQVRTISIIFKNLGIVGGECEL